MYKNKNKEEYDAEPVEYCRRCLSLNIQEEDDTIFCYDCGSQHIATNYFKVNIKEWERLFYEEYGQPFINMPNEIIKLINTNIIRSLCSNKGISNPPLVVAPELFDTIGFAPGVEIPPTFNSPCSLNASSKGNI
jgi:hypothetical protein